MAAVSNTWFEDLLAIGADDETRFGDARWDQENRRLHCGVPIGEGEPSKTSCDLTFVAWIVGNLAFWVGLPWLLVSIL